MTYVAVDDATGRVVGYVSLASASVVPKDMNIRIRKGTARDLPIPVMLLARLAVDTAFERQGIGGSLLMHALRVTAEIAHQAGVKALIVNPIDAEAEQFYANHGFEILGSIVPVTMNMLTKDIRARIAKVDAALQPDSSGCEALRKKQ